MDNGKNQEETRRQLKLAATALEQVCDRPDIFSDIIEGLVSADKKRFFSAISKLDLPNYRDEDCVVLINTFTVFIPNIEIEMKKVCRLKAKGPGELKAPFKEEAISSLGSNDIKGILDILEAAGLIECWLIPVVSKGQIMTTEIKNIICPGQPQPG
jgi:hypothetical protein